MPKIGTIYDDVNGQVIGGDYGIAWVTYDGRQQGGKIYPETRLEADLLLNEIIQGIKEDCGRVFAEIYPAEKWKYHYSGI